MTDPDEDRPTPPDRVAGPAVVWVLVFAVSVVLCYLSWLMRGTRAAWFNRDVLPLLR